MKEKIWINADKNGEVTWGVDFPRSFYFGNMKSKVADSWQQLQKKLK